MGFFFVLLPHFYRVFLFRLFFSLFPTGMGPFTTAPPVVGGAQQPQSPPPLLLPCFLLDFTGFSTEFHEVLSRVCPVAAETLRSVFDDAPSRSIRIRRCFFFVSFFFKSISRDSYRVFFFFTEFQPETWLDRSTRRFSYRSIGHAVCAFDFSVGNLRRHSLVGSSTNHSASRKFFHRSRFIAAFLLDFSSSSGVIFSCSVLRTSRLLVEFLVLRNL